MSRFVVSSEWTQYGAREYHVVDTNPIVPIVYTTIPWTVDAYESNVGSGRAAAVATALNANPPS